MKNKIFELPLLRPFVGQLGGLKNSFRLKKNKLLKIAEVLKIPDSSHFRIHRIFERTGDLGSFSFNYLVEQFKELSGSDLADPISLEAIRINPGDIFPSEEVSETISSYIAVFGGLHYLNLEQFIKLNSILQDCYKTIESRFPHKTDLLISLKENSFPAPFISNLETWDFDGSIELYQINKIMTSMIYSFKQDKYSCSIHSTQISDLLSGVSQESFTSIIIHFKHIGYQYELDSSLTIYWGDRVKDSEFNSKVKQILSKLLFN